MVPACPLTRRLDMGGGCEVTFKSLSSDYQIKQGLKNRKEQLTLVAVSQADSLLAVFTLLRACSGFRATHTKAQKTVEWYYGGVRPNIFLN